MCSACGNGSCRRGLVCRGYRSSVGSPEGYNRSSFSTHQTHHEVGGQRQSFTTPLGFQNARPRYATTMGISDGRNEMAGLYNGGSAYAVGSDHSATAPSLLNPQQSTPLAPVVQTHYEYPQIASYPNPSVSIGTSSGASISQTYQSPAQYQDFHNPSQTPHNNELNYGQYESTVSATGLPAGQVYYPYAASIASAQMQSYGPVSTQAGLQHDHSRPSQFPQTYYHQEEPPDSVPSSSGSGSQYASQPSLSSSYNHYPEYGREPAASYSSDMDPFQTQPYSAGPSEQQTETFQHRSGSHATNSLTASQISPQAPGGFNFPNGPSSYPHGQQFSGNQMSPQAYGSFTSTNGPPSYSNNHQYSGNRMYSQAPNTFTSTNSRLPPSYPSTQSFSGNQMSLQAPGSLTPTSDPPSPSYSDTQRSSTNQMSPSMASVDNSTQTPSYAPFAYPGACEHSKCSESDKIYQTEQKWKAHNLRKHDKPHACGYHDCSMRFGSKTDRQRHWVAHHKDVSEAPELWCEIANCQGNNKLFYRIDKLKDHNKTWHGPWPCHESGCARGLGHGFKNEITLKRHSRSHGD